MSNVEKSDAINDRLKRIIVDTMGANAIDVYGNPYTDEQVPSAERRKESNRFAGVIEDKYKPIRGW